MAKPGSKRSILFWKYYDQWIDTYKLGQVTEVTFNKYKLIDRKIKMYCPDLRLSDVTRDDIQRLINEYGKTHELATTRDFMHHLQAPLRDAVYEGWLKRDPTYKIRPTSMVKHVSRRKKYLDEEETRRLVSVLNKHPSISSTMFDFDLRTGLRFAEIFGLTPKDVNFQENTIYVNKTYDYKGQTRDVGHFQPTKNQYSVRTLTIDPKAKEDLQKVIYGCLPDKSIFITAFKNEYLNRPHTVQKPLAKCVIYNSTFNKQLTKYCKEANIPRITVHGLRHTHASLLIANGISIQSVAKRLGHGDTTTTQKTYIHLLDEMKRRDDKKMVNALERL